MVAVISFLSESLNGSRIVASVDDDKIITLDFCRELIAATPDEW